MNQFRWNDLLPVFVSITVIILVATLQKYSKPVAAVTATMPLTIPLALWIVYSSTQGDRSSVESFTRSMVVGIIPTMAFALALWVGARAGFKLGAMLGLGYTTWLVTLLIVLGIRRWLGV